MPVARSSGIEALMAPRRWDRRRAFDARGIERPQVDDQAASRRDSDGMVSQGAR